MSKNQEVATPVIRRLPRYYRFISNLLADGVERISSKELSIKMGLTASQIRQDLNCFGGFGQQGYGYNLHTLQEKIGIILGIDKKIKTVLVGAGNIGRAVGSRMDFESAGFSIQAVFDNDESVIGKTIRDVPVIDAKIMREYCEKNSIKAAIVCVNDASARKVVESLIESGVEIFWNFTHYDIQLSYPNKELAIENVHLNDSLMTLRYLAKERI